MNLPPLPEPDGWIGANDIDPAAGVAGYTADQLRAYAAEAVQAERERCCRVVQVHQDDNVSRAMVLCIRAGDDYL